MGSWKKELIRVVLLIVIYILLGNARSIQENPFIDGASIAVNMIIPVLAGILYGARTGLLVGFFGTLANVFSPLWFPLQEDVVTLQSLWLSIEMLAVLPHAIMGFTAGMLRKKFPTPIASVAILLGHALNLVIFTVFRKIDMGVFTSFDFWQGILYETFVGMIAIIILAEVYRLAVE